MRITKIEKIILGVIVFLAIATFASCTILFRSIEEHGGIKSVTIDAGKEIKSVIKEINKD